MSAVRLRAAVAACLGLDLERLLQAGARFLSAGERRGGDHGFGSHSDPGSVQAPVRIPPKDAVISLDAGMPCLQATNALSCGSPGSLFTALGFRRVGVTFACWLGVKLARPHRPVVGLNGDRGFGITVAELSSAVHLGNHTIALVMSNGRRGAKKARQRDLFQGRCIGTDIANPPFDRPGELYGAVGIRAANLTEARDALVGALNCEAPVVIDRAEDANVQYGVGRDSFVHRGGT